MTSALSDTSHPTHATYHPFSTLPDEMCLGVAFHLQLHEVETLRAVSRRFRPTDGPTALAAACSRHAPLRMFDGGLREPARKHCSISMAYARADAQLDACAPIGRRA